MEEVSADHLTKTLGLPSGQGVIFSPPLHSTMFGQETAQLSKREPHNSNGRGKLILNFKVLPPNVLPFRK
jgi:hypothetical protein